MYQQRGGRASCIAWLTAAVQEEGEGEMRGVGCCGRDRGGILTLGFSDPPPLPPTAKVVVVGSQIRPQDREREGVIFKAAVPPPQQEQGEEFGIWFASDRGIFENLPSGGGCNKENGWLDRSTVGGGGGETYCAAVSRRRSERGTRSFEPCSNNPLSICKVSQEPL